MYRKIGCLICIMFLIVAMVSCSEKKEAAAPNATAPNAVPLQVFKQEISVPTPPQTLKVNEAKVLDVTVKNTGNESWPSTGIDEKGTNRVGLGYRWLDNAGTTIQEGRTLLPKDLLPGESVSLKVKIQAPTAAGDYKLRFSMVQELVAWFHDKGATPVVVEVKVK